MSTTQRSARRFLTYFFALVGVAIVTVVYDLALPREYSAIVSLSFVLVVLFASMFGGLGAGILCSIFASLCLNYFFLPPTHTLRIDNPQDWIAFAAFVISTLIVSHLSSSVKKRAVEAERKSHELSKLLTLSQAMIDIANVESSLSFLARSIRDTFSFEHCSIHVPCPDGKWQIHSADSNFPQFESAPIHINTLLEEYESGVRYVAIKAGNEQIGMLMVKSGTVPSQTLNGIATLLALMLDRSRLMGGYSGRPSTS